jgi:hypothetical protein
LLLQAWVDPVNLPTQQQLTCPVTGQIMKFLLQIYCPVDSNPVNAFHRSLFVFISPKVRSAQSCGAAVAFSVGAQQGLEHCMGR